LARTSSRTPGLERIAQFFAWFFKSVDKAPRDQIVATFLKVRLLDVFPKGTAAETSAE